MAKVIHYKHDPKIHGPFFGVRKGIVSWNMYSRKRKPPDSTAPDEQTQCPPESAEECLLRIVEAQMAEERKRGE